MKTTDPAIINIMTHLFIFSDPIINDLINRHGQIEQNDRKRDVFEDLVDSITSQQLSTKASATIFDRVKKLFPNNKITPKKILDIKHSTLRQCGLSNAKANYVLDLAAKTLDGTIQLDKLAQMTDEEIVEHLIRVKGIGRWTAEMLLMFTFERPDVFPVDDLGIQKAMCKLYNLKPTKTLKNRMQKIAKAWIPNRTLACRYLWKSLDNK